MLRLYNLIYDHIFAYEIINTVSKFVYYKTYYQFHLIYIKIFYTNLINTTNTIHHFCYRKYLRVKSSIDLMLPMQNK